MAIQVEQKSTKLISVHDQPASLRLEVGGGVTPGIYLIPPVSADPKVFANCIFTFPKKDPIQYAVLKELNGKKYVEVRVFEGKTANYGTELDQKTDEYGKAMEPQLRRALLTVTAEEIANELENQARFFDQNVGVIATDQEVTESLLALVTKNNIDFMRKNVTETNKHMKFGAGNATEHARLHAWKLHKMGLLNPLPEWATINPAGGVAEDTQTCANCGMVLSKNTSKCPNAGCGTILNWKLAVERGQVIPRDVPRSKRVEAGLEPDELERVVREPISKAVMKADVKERVAQSFAARDSQE